MTQHKDIHAEVLKLVEALHEISEGTHGPAIRVALKALSTAPALLERVKKLENAARVLLVGWVQDCVEPERQEDEVQAIHVKCGDLRQFLKALAPFADGRPEHATPASRQPIS